MRAKTYGEVPLKPAISAREMIDGDLPSLVGCVHFLPN
jgi:hypothetical protein